MLSITPLPDLDNYVTCDILVAASCRGHRAPPLACSLVRSRIFLARRIFDRALSERAAPARLTSRGSARLTNGAAQYVALAGRFRPKPWGKDRAPRRNCRRAIIATSGEGGPVERSQWPDGRTAIRQEFALRTCNAVTRRPFIAPIEQDRRRRDGRCGLARLGESGAGPPSQPAASRSGRR